MSCQLCGAAVSDARVCTGCSRRLELALGDVPALVADLETVLAKLTVYADQAQRVTGSKAGEEVVPFNLTAGLAREHLRYVLLSWVRIVHKERYGVDENRDTARTGQNAPVSDFHPLVDRQGLPRAQARSLPPDRDAARAGWLIGRPAPGEMIEIEWIRHQRWAAEAIDNLLGAINDVRHCLDAPAIRATIHVGPCPELDCHGEVRAFIPRDEDTMAHAGCTIDPLHTWDPTQWTRLGKRMLRLEVA